MAALLLRLFYIHVAEMDAPLRADAGQYFRIASNVVEHATFSTSMPNAAVIVPDSYRAPGYPALLALLIRVTGSVNAAYTAVLILQCFLGAGTVALSILLASRFMRRGFALAAGVGSALWPHMITLCGYALIETVFGFLVLLAALLLSEALAHPTRRMFSAAGIAMALGILVNQILLAFVLPVALRLLLRPRSGALALILLSLVPPLLWATRDAQVHSPPRLSAASRVMENIALGAEPDFVPRYRLGADAPAAVAARNRIEAERDLFETDHVQGIAKVWIHLSSNPVSTILWYLSKPARFWTWSIEQGAGDVYVYPMTYPPFHEVAGLRAIASVCHVLNNPLFWAALVGLMLVLLRAKDFDPRARHAALMVGWFFSCATLIHTVLMPDARYAVPFRPFEIMLAVFAAACLIQLFGSSAAKRNSRAPIAENGIEPLENTRQGGRSIRDVMAFLKSRVARDLLPELPLAAPEAQLRETLRVAKPAKFDRNPPVDME